MLIVRRQRLLSLNFVFIVRTTILLYFKDTRHTAPQLENTFICQHDSSAN